MRIISNRFLCLVTAALLVGFTGAGCSSKGDGEAAQGGAPAARQSGGRPGGGRGGPGGGGPPGGGQAAAVPVEVVVAQAGQISSFIETNGVLEAENDVDLVARVSGPIVALSGEEGMQVRKGRRLAQIDPDSLRAQVEIARVDLNETRLAYERAENLQREELISREQFEQIRARFESAKAQFEGQELTLAYTDIEAPFTGQIVERYVKLAETVSVGTPLFRLADFDPLLCPIQVPERELPLLSVGQRAYLVVEAWPDERFPARILRLSPVVDASTGTVKVTLQVAARSRLRPGMFASVYLETETRENTVVVPKRALALESLGDTVYVAEGTTASRREVELGFREGDRVEILSGLAPGEQVVVVGQDGLSDGTPIQVLGVSGEVASPEGRPGAVGQAKAGPGNDDASPRLGRGALSTETGQPRTPRRDQTPPTQQPTASGGGNPSSAASAPGALQGGRRQGGGSQGQGGGRELWRRIPNLETATPEQIEEIKQRMRDRGLTEERIEEMLQRVRERQKQESGGGSPS